MRFVYTVSPALVLAVLGAQPLCAQVNAEHPRVAQALEVARVWLEAQRAYDQIPGVSAAIVHDQQVLWSGGYGLADVALFPAEALLGRTSPLLISGAIASLAFFGIAFVFWNHMCGKYAGGGG